MIKIKILSIIIAVLHAMTMIIFANGAELSPLMVWIIDFPIAALFELGGLEFSKFIYEIIIVSSIMYSLIFFLIGKLVIKLIYRNKT